MSAHLDLPITMMPGILYFIAAQLLVHSFFCWVVWEASLTITDFFQLSFKYETRIAISFWVFGIISIFLINQYFFPNSKFSELSSIIFFDQWLPFLTIISGIGMGVLFFLALLRSRIVQLTVLLMFIDYAWHAIPFYSFHHSVTSVEKPNIIIVGVDSLRPDFLGFFGHETATPFLDTFLKGAHVFSEAMTPLARTFPSWTGILTGEYPRESGVRTNLTNQTHLDFSHSLPSLLRQQGYTTWYATDETRFSNIDTNFGFDKIITPPIGLNDFLIGTFNDFPLSNLLINTPAGRWLFPYNYANRPAYFSYDPDSFLQLVKPYLYQAQQKPLFLAVHFCLPHYPYLWAHLSGYQFSAQSRYEQSVLRVDQQLRDFFALLQKTHLLDHAIVVLLSDHGEALELPGDRVTELDLLINPHKKPLPQFYLSKQDEKSFNLSVGHGTDVLSLTQYHTLLAFKWFGFGEQSPSLIPGPVSLLQIKPTLLSAIQHRVLPNALMTAIEKKEMPPRQHIFIESDFTPDAIRTVYPETKQVVLEGIQLFQIDPHSTRLTVKKDMVQMIIQSKQYADVYGDWLLAFYPQDKHHRIPVLVNLRTGEWTTDLTTAWARHSPVKSMQIALINAIKN